MSSCRISCSSSAWSAARSGVHHRPGSAGRAMLMTIIAGVPIFRFVFQVGTGMLPYIRFV